MSLHLLRPAARMQQIVSIKHLIVDFLIMTIMKRHIIIAIVAVAISAGFMSNEATAQTIAATYDLTAESADVVSRAGKVLCVDGKRLSAAETFDYVSDRCGLPYAQRWNNSARLYGAGKGLLISSAVTIPVGVVSTWFGAAFTVAGAIGSAASGVGDNEPNQGSVNALTGGVFLMYGGVFVAAVGVSSLIAGAVCLPIGKSRMNDIVDRCNSANSGRDITLNFGPCPHGIGMTLNF